MTKGLKPRTRNVQQISAGQPSPKWFTALPDPLAFRDEVRLTDDERLTLIGLANGFTLREIQARLDIGYKVAQRHRDGIYRKLGTRNDAHSIFIGIQRGELNP